MHRSWRPRTDAAWLEAHWMPYTGNRNSRPSALMVSAKVVTTPTTWHNSFLMACPAVVLWLDTDARRSPMR